MLHGFTPLGDFFVVAREEDVRDFLAAELGGLSVLGGLNGVSRGEALHGGRSLAAEDTGEEADDGVNDDEGGELAAG